MPDRLKSDVHVHYCREFVRGRLTRRVNTRRSLQYIESWLVIQPRVHDCRKHDDGTGEWPVDRLRLTCRLSRRFLVPPHLAISYLSDTVGLQHVPYKLVLILIIGIFDLVIEWPQIYATIYVMSCHRDGTSLVLVKLDYNNICHMVDGICTYVCSVPKTWPQDRRQDRKELLVPGEDELLSHYRSTINCRFIRQLTVLR